MKLLMDTHTFLWWANDPGKLSARVLALCQDPQTDLILSVVSIWEIQIKTQIGRLILPTSLPTLITSQLQVNHFQILPVYFSHVLALEGLPLHHNDPFDRLLIAQTNTEGAFLASKDGVISKYPVQILW